MIRTFLYSLSISLAGLLTQAAQAQVKPAGDTSIKKTAVDTSAPKPAQRPPATAAPSKRAVDTSGHKTAQRLPVAPVPAKKPDSVYYVPGGLRLGIDISRFVLHFFQP